jgi:hypothetical protein
MTDGAPAAAAGLVLQPAWLRLATPNVAWQGLRELHLRAVGSDYQFTTVAGRLSKADAFATYGSALAATLGQLAVADDAAANRLLGSLADFGGAMASLDGLESPFLTAFSAAFRVGATDSVDRAAEVWSSVGQPRQLGGGVLGAPVVSAGGVLTLVGADDLAQLADVSGAAAMELAVVELFKADVARDPSSDDEGTAPTGLYADALQTVGRALVRLAVGVAGAAELEDHDIAGPAPVAAIKAALERVQVHGQPLLRPSRAMASVAQGKAVVVEVGIVGADAQPPPAQHAGPPRSISPQLPTLAAGPAGGFDLGPSAFWRGATVAPVPAFTLAAQGLDSQLHVRGHTVALPGLPRLRKDGSVFPRGLLSSLLDPPPASPVPHTPGSLDNLILDPHAGELPQIVIVMPAHFPPLVLPEKPGHATPPEVARLVQAVTESLARLSRG